MASEHQHSEHNEDNMTFQVGGNTLLAVSILLSSIILTSGIIIGTGNISSGLASLEITAASSAGTLSGGTTTGGTGSTAPAPTPPAPSPPATGASLADIDLDNEFFKGDPNAPITIVEYSDFQCPFCSRFFDNTLDQLTQEYIDTGKVRFVYRHFPLESIHPQARPAALAAECAGAQGQFWEFHDKVFENQATLSATSYKAWAGELGLDQSAFDTCFDTAAFNADVDADFDAGRSAGVSGTPSFLVGPSDGDGELLVGAQPFSTFQSAIDALE